MSSMRMSSLLWYARDYVNYCDLRYVKECIDYCDCNHDTSTVVEYLTHSDIPRSSWVTDFGTPSPRSQRDRAPIPASLIHRLPHLQLVVFTGERNSKLDIDALAARGMYVTMMIMIVA